jgi:hypothetical protein
LTWSWFGFGAEDVDQIDFRFCIYTHPETGKYEKHTVEDKEFQGGPILDKSRWIPDGVNHNAILAALVQLVQRQEARIAALEAR